MKNKTIILIALSIFLLLTSCTTTNIDTKDRSLVGLAPDVQYKVVFDEYEKYDGSVCMGISGPHTDQDKAIKLATERCLQMLAYSLQVNVTTKMGTVATLDGSVTEEALVSEGGATRETYIQAAKEMEIVDIIWYGDLVGAVVFARTPNMEKVNWNHTDNWINSPPSIKGYSVVVGKTEQNYSGLNSIIEASTYQAALALTNLADERIVLANQISRQENDNSRLDLYSMTGTKLKNFVILDYYYDRAKGAGYALGCSKN